MRNFARVAVQEYNRRTVPIGGLASLNPNPADTSMRDAFERGGLYSWVPDRPPEQARQLNAHFQQAGYNWNPTRSGFVSTIVPPGHRAGRDSIFTRGRPG